jgi:hypothetical protein
VVTRFKYDRQNNKIEALVLKNHLVTTKTTFGYDAKKNLIEKSSYGIQGALESRHQFLYEYDGEGNWIKRISVFNERPTSVLRRRIEYY